MVKREIVGTTSDAYQAFTRIIFDSVDVIRAKVKILSGVSLFSFRACDGREFPMGDEGGRLPTDLIYRSGRVASRELANNGGPKSQEVIFENGILLHGFWAEYGAAGDIDLTIIDGAGGSTVGYLHYAAAATVAAFPALNADNVPKPGPIMIPPGWGVKVTTTSASVSVDYAYWGVELAQDV